MEYISKNHLKSGKLEVILRWVSKLEVEVWSYLKQNWNYLYFLVSLSSYSISCVELRHRTIKGVSDLNFEGQLPKPDDRRNLDTQQLRESVIWTSRVICPSRATEETSTPNNTSRRCKNEERSTGTNTTNWMERRWSLKIKVIPIFNLTEIFSSVHET